jgi:uncharacterized protein (TIGR02145 family)
MKYLPSFLIFLLIFISCNTEEPTTDEPTYPKGSFFGPLGPTIVIDVTNPITGRTWMDRNLGASRAATSQSDSASFGDLYQWGRGVDGHQLRNSSTTLTLSSRDQPGNRSFIVINPPSYLTPQDWRSPQNNTLWRGVNGINNPCPNGYRLPTEEELNEERLSWSTNDAAGAFSSPLKLPTAGYRLNNNGSIINSGVNGDGYYWSSTVDNEYSYSLYFHQVNNTLTRINNRAIGLSVRCIKD